MAERDILDRYHIYTVDGEAKLSVLELRPDKIFKVKHFDLSHSDLLILQEGAGRALSHIYHKRGK